MMAKMIFRGIYLKLSAIILIIIIIVSCEKENQPVILYVLIDTSNSVNSSPETAKYLQWFQGLCDQITDKENINGAQLIVRIILGGDSPFSSIIIDGPDGKILPLPHCSFFTDAPFDCKKLLDQAIRDRNDKKQLWLESVKNAIINQRSIRTPLIYSINETAKQINIYGSFSKKILIIFSDMRENSDILNLEKEIIQRKNIQIKLDHIRRIGLIPNLKNVEVYLVGGRDQNLEKIMGLEIFWREYFKECGSKKPLFFRDMPYMAFMNDEAEANLKEKSKLKHYISGVYTFF